MKKYIVDRVEDNVVFLEDDETKEIIEVSKDIISFDVRDGDLLDYENGTYNINKEETASRKKRIKNKFELLKSKTIEK